MIGISKLYCGAVEPSDALRYHRMSNKLPSHLLQFSIDKKPVIVWNITQRCNLKCVHCYAHAKDIQDAQDKALNNELSTQDGKKIIDDLANFGVPVLLFSGGEPLVRKDLPELAEYAVSKNIRAVISTNGTLINQNIARVLKQIGLSYVGISLDGMEYINDFFRGVKGAFKLALKGIENCQKEGIKVGLRFTINKFNYLEIPKIFDLIEQLEVPRICFYHLVYAGRGSNLVNDDLSHEQTRETLDLIINRTWELFQKGKPKEVLTVDNHADGPYIYLRLLKENPKRAQEVLELLKMNEGNNSGKGIGCISWNGDVHADQFWRHLSFGNVKQNLFSQIWTNAAQNLNNANSENSEISKTNDILAKLKEKKKYVKGRCSVCKWLDICGGNFRVRAEAITGDIWAPDPACYLTDKEILN